MQHKIMYSLIAIGIIIIWSTTFVSTKILLQTLTPVEIMFYRYVLAYLVLLVVYPKHHSSGGLREELLFCGAGISGGTIYFLTENYALKYTLASNVGLLVATAPMLTAIAAHFLVKNEPFNRSLGLGFLVAFAGAFLVIFNGHFVLKLNPYGDFLAIAAACSWAFYSILVKKIGNRYHSIYITRKIFFYSLLTMIPILFVTDFHWELTRLYSMPVIANLLFLGILASSICFLLWSKVIWKLGAVQANNFIYLVPLVTMLASIIVLSEQVTFFAVLGGLLILAGVYISSVGEKLLQQIALKRWHSSFFSKRKSSQ